MIPKRRKPAPLGLREAPQIRSKGHRQWTRGFECVIAEKHTCNGIMHAHHIRKGTDGTQKEKPSDCYVVPLCAAAHTEVHTGHDTFERKYGVNLLKIAADLWRASPHRRKWEARQADLRG